MKSYSEKRDEIEFQKVKDFKIKKIKEDEVLKQKESYIQAKDRAEELKQNLQNNENFEGIYALNKDDYKYMQECINAIALDSEHLEKDLEVIEKKQNKEMNLSPCFNPSDCSRKEFENKIKGQKNSKKFASIEESQLGHKLKFKLFKQFPYVQDLLICDKKLVYKLNYPEDIEKLENFLIKLQRKSLLIKEDDRNKQILDFIDSLKHNRDIILNEQIAEKNKLSNSVEVDFEDQLNKFDSKLENKIVKVIQKENKKLSVNDKISKILKDQDDKRKSDDERLTKILSEENENFTNVNKKIKRKDVCERVILDGTVFDAEDLEKLESNAKVEQQIDHLKISDFVLDKEFDGHIFDTVDIEKLEQELKIIENKQEDVKQDNKPNPSLEEELEEKLIMAYGQLIKAKREFRKAKENLKSFSGRVKSTSETV